MSIWLGAIVVMLMGMLVPAAQAADDGGPRWTVDPSTQNAWFDDPDHGVSIGGDDFSSENAGRVWADKTVYAGDATLKDPYGGPTITVPDGDPETALVGLSALSSTAEITHVREPRDIVLVIDTSLYMLDAFSGYEYTPVYAPDPESTYYIENVDGTYDAVTYDAASGWTTGDGVRVTPATAGEPVGDGVAVFHSRTEGLVKRAPALEAAARRFIRQTVASNQGLEEGRRTRIGIVKMGGRGADPGNGTYINSTGAPESYTQIVAGLTDDGAVLESRLGELMTAEDEYRYLGGPSSATDLAIDKADEALNGAGSRPDARKIAIVFGAGEPSHQGWEAGYSSSAVAANAINAARGLKRDGVTFYGVGIYDKAAADSFDEDTNAALNGISSRYPDASATITVDPQTWQQRLVVTRGEAASGEYFFAANDAETLGHVLDFVRQDADVATASPVTGDFGSGPGTLTFTDVLGDYMEVRDLRSIVCAGRQFTRKDSAVRPDGSVSHTFQGVVEAPNVLYDSGDLADIRITVTPEATLADGDTVTVSIPETLLPMRHYGATVSEDGTVTTEHVPAQPIRVFYSVGLKPEARQALADPDTLGGADAAALRDYIGLHGHDDGSVDFFSNDVAVTAEGADALTTATFTPSAGNGFYRFVERTPLLTAEHPDSVFAGDAIDPNATYYYRHRYGDMNHDEWRYRYIPVAGDDALLAGAGNLVHDGETGAWSIRAGVPRYGHAEEFVSVKTRNATGTAPNAISPSWDGTGEAVVTLGNNGRYRYAPPKDVDKGDEVKPDASSDGQSVGVGDHLTYAIDWTNTAVDEYGNAVDATVTIRDTVPDGTDLVEGAVSDNGTVKGRVITWNIAAKPGQSGTVSFTVAVNGDAPELPDDTVGNTAFITIDGGPATATNTVSNPVGGTTAIIPVTKIIENRGFQKGDAFEFTIEPCGDDTVQAVKAGKVVMPESTTATIAWSEGDDTNDGGTNRKDGAFDAIAFHAPGTYTFEVKETKGDIAGITYDDTVYMVTVEVADLAAVPTITMASAGDAMPSDGDGRNISRNGRAVFINVYEAVGGATIKGTKHLENGRLSGNDFQFQVVNDANGQIVSTGINDATGAVNFSAIDYTVAQLIADYTADAPAVDYNDATYTYTYHYTVSEVTPLPDGVTAQDASFKIMVNLKDNGDGTLKVDVVYPDGTPGTGLAFRNSYGDNAKATVNVSGDKMLVLADPSLNPPNITGKFIFTLTGVDENGNPAPLPDDATDSVTATNDGTGTVEFGDIVYTMENTFGTTSGVTTEGTEEGVEGIDMQIAQRTKTFTYTVTESGGVGGVTNDAQTHTFTVTVTDNGDGTLDAVCSETPGDQFSFTNTYSVEPVRSTPDIEITKQLAGREIRDGEFGFRMSGVSAPDGIDPTSSVLIARNVGVDVDFDDITFTKPGEYKYAISEIPGDRGGVTYDGAVYFAIATVTDNQNGTLSVSWTYTDADGEAISKDAGIAFKNTYEAAPVPVTLGATKVLDGREMKDGEFAFELTDGRNADGEQAPMPGGSQKTTVTATNAANGAVTFDPITFDKVGIYTYTMREVAGDEEGMTYDDTEYSIVITVTDDGEGRLTATTSILNGTDEVDGIIFANTYEAPDGPMPETEGTVKEPGNDIHIPGTGAESAAVVVVTVMLLVAAAGVTAMRSVI